ncbi:ribosome biogenesis protein NOP53-like isoform X2 [Paramacrobiotus metropolitanus]|uniref:ribosome biogenesis protein NOP53-like isoform X2 n=1 Tax=Paramacrobiotus metropolitanus TaxID=2943436 RepID=UPI002445B796|nr:ribosome biogenesis protein NOP53-like isoform X2 [Paramacrobiotus metropolitanus]
MDDLIPTKKRRVKGNKNRHRAVWRKSSNVADVEDFIEEQRENDRLGLGGGLHEKKDAELFIVEDSLPQPETSRVAVKEETPDIPLGSPSFPLFPLSKSSFKPILPKSLWKDLQCFKSLSGGRSSEKIKPHARKTTEIKACKLQRYHDAVALRKARKAVRAAQPRGVTKSHKDPLFNRDLWAGDGASGTGSEVPEERKPAISRPQRAPMTLQSRVKSTLAAVELPHPGTSYNPAPADHQSLLSSATEKAQAQQREEEKLRDFSKKRTVADKCASDSWMDEMRQGLPGAEVESTVDDAPAGEDVEEFEINRKTAGDARKTKKERRKQKLLEEQKSQRLKLKEKKILEHEVFSVKKILKRLDVKAKEDAAQALVRKAKRDDPLRLRKLSKYKFEEANPDVQLPEDMADNLRTLRPEGNLLLDRYKSLQRRNIVEPRRRQKIKRKYKLKSYQIEGRKLEELKT